MGKVKIEIYCYLIAVILTKVLQKGLLGGPPPSISFQSKPFNCIDILATKRLDLRNQLLRSYMGDKAETLRNCS